MEEGTSCERNRSAVMAVEAHEYSSNLFLVPDLRTSGQEVQQTGEHLQLIGSTIRASNTHHQEAVKRPQILCGPVFHYPELTPKMLAESTTRRKRIREEEEGVYLFSNSLSTPCTSTAAATGILQNRMQGSTIASYHNAETDALIRMHTKKLGLGLEEMRKRHCRALLSVLEQQTAKLLQEKDAELESIKLRNTEMVETVNRMAVDVQTWFNIASNNESIAANLRATLDQVLKDTFGAGGQADNAQSCCFEEEEMEGTAIEACEAKVAEKLRGWWSCKACWKRDLSVLLLPCRHLCLCTNCAPVTATCPICHCVKNGSIQVFLF